MSYSESNLAEFMKLYQPEIGDYLRRTPNIMRSIAKQKKLSKLKKIKIVKNTGQDGDPGQNCRAALDVMAKENAVPSSEEPRFQLSVQNMLKSLEID